MTRKDKLKEDKRGAGKVERVYIILHQRQYATVYMEKQNITIKVVVLMELSVVVADVPKQERQNHHQNIAH